MPKEIDEMLWNVLLLSLSCPSFFLWELPIHFYFIILHTQHIYHKPLKSPTFHSLFTQRIHIHSLECRVISNLSMNGRKSNQNANEISTSSKSNQFVSMSRLLGSKRALQMLCIQQNNPHLHSNMLDMLKGIYAYRIHIRLHWIDFGANCYANHSHFFASLLQCLFLGIRTNFPLLFVKIHFGFHTITTLRAAFHQHCSFQIELLDFKIRQFFAETSTKRELRQ